ncbi:transcription factor BIM1-like [Lolium rigidum]|uniref:transcription factor BIM1-like n=1 Tax=Lolium rigidum TaxID=89674 RepID=UPI001F5D006D|nr:transcription factor BIM1-like [Lolium rigidum]
MGLQGNKATHDFLSLYAPAAKESSLPQLPGAKPPPTPPAQGFLLRTHDFLQPLERPSQSPPPPPPPQAPSGHDSKQQLHSQHALPGGVGTFSISHAPAVPVAAAVKQEPPFALQWGAAAADPRGHQWTLPFAARGVASARPQRQQQQPATERKCGGSGFMDAAASGSSGAAGFDDEDGLAARREVSSSLKELAVRVDAKGGSCSGSAGTDQLPNTPRSKHSATEQRRRSKINDRFQLLREILPHNDQKRDKASFLLEVIEYIRFLQEKVQKYEVSYPEWNPENANVVPWANMYFRSFWKNGQNKDQLPGDTLPDPSQILKNGSSPGFPFIVKSDDNDNVVASAVPSGAPDHAEADPSGSMSYKSTETPSPIIRDNVTSQQQTHQPISSPAEHRGINNEMFSNPELAIDEGTISLSSQYSQELLSTLNHALQNSGIDLSQASISVQINLGKRATKRSDAAPSASTEIVDPACSSKKMDHQLRLGDGVQEHPRATKRHKSHNS